MRYSKLLVVGLGLMGTSLIKAVKQYFELSDISGSSFAGVDILPDVVTKALSDGVITEGASLNDDVAVKGLIETSTFIVLAMYPAAMVPFIEQYKNDFQPGTVIMDISGLKSGILETCQSLIKDGVEYIGTHPMAGSEHSGYDYARYDLFKDTNFIITPTAKNTPEIIESVKTLAKCIGCSNITVVTPQKHDRIIAYTSQLPHLLAAGLVASWKGEEDVVSYMGGSFKDATRVAMINPKLWSELFLLNRSELSVAIQHLEEELSQLLSFLSVNNQEALEAYLTSVGETKKRWNECGLGGPKEEKNE